MLTEREKEIIELISEGLTNKEIAEKLMISGHTVKAHKEHIYEKLQVHNSTQLIVKYYKLNVNFE